MQLEQLYLLAVSLVLAVFVFGFLIWLMPVAGAGFKTKRFEHLGWRVVLVELTAQQRIEFLQRSVGVGSDESVSIIVKNLVMAVDVGSLHMRRWYMPAWFIQWRLRRLPDELLAALFRECVQLSQLPFDIEQTEVEPEASLKSIDEEIAASDGWDYLDEEPEKKPSPAAHQSGSVMS
jgi:hypothetical protein